ncbi:hypothetical protein MM26B8_00190 [Mycoplasmopsis meleagridis]|uniref:DUF2188 domain-containing protein n=1 Tax=Mycoplasmopsis meleagridis ATCC 25294 TaxID=1264554 RepID=A0A0F5H0J3_9BACT|nr:DUF2188 domain-containing protein [Mycoplasmopsis meleagridis]KKB26841.1 hypothetical protein MMELEA_05240 [Mycoplasmopsis meleagridis ATCC 25294]KUH47388.1 hypothetical protein ASB56_01620 [Mycoplasmopsis meleagridis]OAD18577.1 hypothetical protein MM26B8_00190 [Mycoplasmopsis meleagridis]VEU77420.1 Uncharacterised protein [Mycoplasmopsis meleagridis]
MAKEINNIELDKEVKNYHVTPKKGSDEWQVKGAGNERATKLFPTQKEAIAYARSLAEKRFGTVYVHGENGRVRDSYKYANKKPTTNNK